MHVNFVTESQSWALRPWAIAWAVFLEKEGFTTSINTKGDGSSDVNVYVDYTFFRKKTGCDIAIYTHREKDEEFWSYECFESSKKKVDWCFAQNSYTKELLPPEKTSMISVPLRAGFRRPLRIGFVGREYETGRKRVDMIHKLRDRLKQSGTDGFEFLFSGQDRDVSGMIEFYEDVDYILITSEAEGGPLCFAEALSMGVPVIAPEGVGWSGNYTCITFSDYDDLVDVMRGLRYPSNEQGCITLRNKINELIND
jgi:glycosyltransferase involved in cell wall biosynthesis